MATVACEEEKGQDGDVRVTVAVSDTDGGFGATAAPPSMDSPPTDGPTRTSPGGGPQGGSPSSWSPSSPPSSCTDDVIVTTQCWTEKFPPDAYGSSDVACRFTMMCCGELVQDWRRTYPQSAGPSGVVRNTSKHLTVKCRSDSQALGDVDGDGIANTADANPLTPGESGKPW